MKLKILVFVISLILLSGVTLAHYDAETNTYYKVKSSIKYDIKTDVELDDLNIYGSYKKKFSCGSFSSH